MSSCPLQVSRQVSRWPLRLRSIGAQTEFIVLGTGENVVARSWAWSAVRHLDDSWGGPITPPVAVRLVIFHKPGSMPSANAAQAINEAANKAAAITATRQTTDILTSRPAQRGASSTLGTNSAYDASGAACR